MLVQMERQIDREIAADNKANGVTFGTQTQNEGQQNSVSTGTDTSNGLFDTDSDDEDENNEPVLMYGPQPQIITNDLKSLDEMVSLSSVDNRSNVFFFLLCFCCLLSAVTANAYSFYCSASSP